MARDAKIMSAAYRQYRQDRDARRLELERREEEVYRRLPRVEAIDRELRGTAAKIVLAAFQQDGDAEEALQELQQNNLELQR